jgi:hypothetical protein
MRPLKKKIADTQKSITVADAQNNFLAVVNSALLDNAPEYQAARRELDCAMYAAGVYREAARTLREIEADLASAKGEHKEALTIARGMLLGRAHSTETLKALAAAPTFEAREVIRSAEVKAQEEREARALATRKAEKERPKQGKPCPHCGAMLGSGGKTADAYCPACFSVFGKQPIPTKKWGKIEDTHLAAVEKWLSDQWRTDAEIKAALTDYVKGRAVVGGRFAPLAWKKGQTILQAELNARHERDKGRAVARDGVILKTQLPKKSASEKRRASISRRNGKKGGRLPTDNPALVQTAVDEVLTYRKYHPGKSMKAACEKAIRDNGLSIEWPALQKHVKKARGA